MNEKLKNILKITALWYGIALILFFGVEYKYFSIHDLLWYLVSPIIVLAFLPTMVALYFICKKIRTKFLKCLLIAYAIPFTNMLYVFIESYIFKADIPAYSCVLGFCSLIMLAVWCVCTLFTPQKWLKLKKEFLVTEVLMFVFGVILMIATLVLCEYISDKCTEYQLKEYDNVIEYIESYKNKNGVYPENINNVEVKPKHFLFYEYNAMENYKGFVLKVAKDEYYPPYRYCSDDKYDGCKEGYSEGMHYAKLGKWMSEYVDD